MHTTFKGAQKFQPLFLYLNLQTLVKYFSTSEKITGAIAQGMIGYSWKPECPIPLQDYQHFSKDPQLLGLTLA